MTERELLKQLEQKITKEYKDTEAVLRQKIAYFTKDFDKDNKLYQQQVKDGKISKNDYNKWYKSQIASKNWSQKMSKEIAKDLTDANITASKLINNNTSEVFMKGCFEASKELKDGANFEVIDKKQIDQIMDDNKRLLPKSRVNIPKDQKWNEKRIQSSLMQSALKGESISKLSNRLINIVGMNRTSAVRNARTMMTASHNMGKLETGYEALDMGIEVRKKWIATFDDRTRDSHALLHGEVVDMDEPFSNGLMFPADPDGDPAEVYNCRCTMALVQGEEKTKGISKKEFDQLKEENEARKAEFREANKELRNQSEGIEEFTAERLFNGTSIDVKEAENALKDWGDGVSYDIRWAQQRGYHTEEGDYIEKLIKESNIHYDTGNDAIYRGIQANEETQRMLNRLITAIDEYDESIMEEYQFFDMLGTSSWSNKKSIAEEFSKNASGIGEIDLGSNLKPCIIELRGIEAKDEAAIYVDDIIGLNQGEILLTKEAKLSMEDIREIDGAYYIDLMYYGKE